MLTLLRGHKTMLAERFGVVDLALFGSTSRDEARPDSDVDILVRFDRPTDPDCYFGVQFYIEDLLGRPVDLVTDRALRTEGGRLIGKRPRRGCSAVPETASIASRP